MKLRLRPEELVWKQIDDEIVILDSRDAVYLTVSGSGALLWRKLAEDATRDELVGALLATYEVEADRAAADTDAFLGELRDQGLLER